MAITQVASQNSGAVADNTTSVSKAFPGNITSGNRIIIVGIKFSPSNDAFAAGDCTKTAGTATIGSIALDIQVNFNYTGGDYIAVGIWSAAVTGTGSCTMQVGGAVAGSYLLIASDEFTSSIGSITFDTGKTSTGTGSTGAPTASAITPSAYDGLIIGGVGTATAGATTHTPGSGFTQIFEEEDGSAHMTGSAIYRVLTSGSGTANWTAPTTVPWAVASAAYIEQAAAGGTWGPLLGLMNNRLVQA